MQVTDLALLEDASATMKKGIERIDELNTQVNSLFSVNSTMADLLKEKNEKIDALETKVRALEGDRKEMLRVMRDYDVLCGECEGDLNDEELPYALCTSCARLLS